MTYPYITYAQFDYIWKLNFSTIDFRFDPPKYYYVRDSIGYTFIDVGATNISDSNYIYQNSTNSNWISNIIHDTMKNGELYQLSLSNTFTPQGSIILPMILKDKYFVIHHVRDKIDMPFTPNPFDFDPQPTYLLYSIIDMSKDGAKGEVVQKNNVLIYDTLANGRFAVCRHANGKDWWLLANEYMTNCYYTILIHPDGTFEPAFKQCIGAVQSYLDEIGQACFSPDGKYYCNAVYNTNGNIDLFRFDRCTGLLYNYQPFYIPTYFHAYVEGCAFSPNSKYLYFSANDKLFQYDIYEPDSTKNRVLLDSVIIDSTIGNYGFQILQVAPNNKIYIGTMYPKNALHVINNPDSIGLLCNYVRFGQPLAFPNNLNATFPYYYLYGSAIYAADAGVDKTICPGDSVILGIKAVKDAVYEWSGDTADLNDIHLAQPTAIPTKTYSTYYLHITDTSDAVSCKERWDTVHVTMIDACIDSVALVIQNPQSALEQAFFTIQNLPEHTGLKLYNMLGELIYQADYYQNDYPLAKLSTGYYIYELKLSEENIFKKYYYKGKVLVY
ncbi:MAG: hypothetical protein WCP57_03855 [Bacteroidota bacterium]